MPPGSRFRKWATQVARQAAEELDDAVASRLLDIAEQYAELAEREEALTAYSDQVSSETSVNRRASSATPTLTPLA